MDFDFFLRIVSAANENFSAESTFFEIFLEFSTTVLEYISSYYEVLFVGMSESQ